MLTILFSSAEHQESALALASFCLGSWYLSVIFTRFSWSSLTYSGWKNWQWFSLPIGDHLGLMTLWILITVGTSAYWIWQALNRRFNNPHCTLISKKQSYWIVGVFQIWLLGLVSPLIPGFKTDEIELGLISISIFNLCFILLVGSMIFSDRQKLIGYNIAIKLKVKITGKK